MDLDVTAGRSTATECTKPSSVIGSSSSGSITASSAPHRPDHADSVGPRQAARQARRSYRRRAARRRARRRRATAAPRHRDVVDLGRVQAEDLLLLLGGHRGVLGQLLGDLEVDESLDQPARRPDRVVGRELDAVLADPVKELADDLREVFGRVWMNGIATARPACTFGSCVAIQQKSSRRGRPQCSTMKFRSVKSGGDMVDVGHVERIAVQRPDRRAFVHVDVADAELSAELEVAVGPGVVELPAARLPVPLGGVELHALRSNRSASARSWSRPASPLRGSK